MDTYHSSSSDLSNDPDANLLSLSVTELTTLFRRREVSPVEYLEAALRRIRRYDGLINAVVELREAAARDAARMAEQTYLKADSSVLNRQPLLGIPIAAKEKHGIQGESISQGLSFVETAPEKRDSALVARIRAAGGYVHARTATPELSATSFTHSSRWGITRNPWNSDYSPGGSSGGSAAAVAAGFAPLATSSDIGGSTRLPAGVTGTVGFKAPYGRIPGPQPASLDWYRSDGPLARTVSDAALFTSVLAGIHPTDHASVPSPYSREDWMSAVRDTNRIGGMRIALSITLGDYPVTSDVAETVERAARTLEHAGAVVDEVTLPWTTESIRETVFAHLGHSQAQMLRDSIAAHEDEVSDYLEDYLSAIDAAATRLSLVDGLKRESEIHSQLAAVMEDHDLLLCPVWAIPGPRAGESYLDGIDVTSSTSGTLRTRHLKHYWEVHMTTPFNIANRNPVLAVPAGRSEEGVPIGVQLVGRPYDDLTVFRAGAALESLAPWPRIATL